MSITGWFSAAFYDLFVFYFLFLSRFCFSHLQVIGQGDALRAEIKASGSLAAPHLKKKSPPPRLRRPTEDEREKQKTPWRGVNVARVMAQASNGGKLPLICKKKPPPPRTWCRGKRKNLIRRDEIKKQVRGD